MPIKTSIEKEVTKPISVEYTGKAVEKIIIDLANQRAEVIFRYGNIVENGVFTPAPHGPTETKVLTNQPERTVSINKEKHIVTNGRITLSLPTTGYIRVEHNDKHLKELVDFTRDGNDLVFSDSGLEDEEIFLSYSGIKDATTDFTDFVFSGVSVEHSLAGNVQINLWEAIGEDPASIVEDEKYL